MRDEARHGADLERLWIRPQKLDDNEADYEAVMDSRDLLREWSHSPWPEDAFTPEENRSDLAEHIADHEAGTDFGYSLWTPEGRFLGSLYLNDPAALFDAYPEAEVVHRRHAVDVRVEYWLRRGTGTEWDELLVTGVSGWLARCGYRSAVWGSRRPMTARRRLYERLGMTELAALVNTDGSRTFFIHGWVKNGST